MDRTKIIKAARIGGRALLWAVAIVALAPFVGAALTRFLPPPMTATMIDRALAGAEVKREWTPLSEISPHLVRAVIAAEDSRFCRHDGFDLEEIDKALKDAKRGKKRRGASTISQQTVKNVFLWQGGGFFRKGLEAWGVFVAEPIWGKRRTIELYLNVAEWGDGLFGAEAAAQGRFGKSAKDLTKKEAALLAAVLPSPNKWRAVNPGPYVRGRAVTLRKRLDIVKRDGLADCALAVPGH
jgi:monofunctional biosynthetic peptidoglycan transglycosylase